jgi:phosphocarrier protein
MVWNFILFNPLSAAFMLEKLATVKNRLGIHARPSALLVQAAAKFTCDITFEKEGLAINGKSIMGVMMLAAEVGAVITVRTDGQDEAVALDKMAEMIESIFD